MSKEEGFKLVREVWDKYKAVDAHYLTSSEMAEIDEILDIILDMIEI